jgi:hypothetical protein
MIAMAIPYGGSFASRQRDIEWHSRSEGLCRLGGAQTVTSLGLATYCLVFAAAELRGEQLYDLRNEQHSRRRNIKMAWICISTEVRRTS